jgi:hypothetical protein
LAQLTGEWPASRLVDVWNSFAGVAPFTELKPVKKVHEPERCRSADSSSNRGFVPRYRGTGGAYRAEQPKSKKSQSKAKRPATPQPGEDRCKKKADVIAMMRRAKSNPTAAGFGSVQVGWQVAFSVRLE